MGRNSSLARPTTRLPERGKALALYRQLVTDAEGATAAEAVLLAALVALALLGAVRAMGSTIAGLLACQATLLSTLGTSAESACPRGAGAGSAAPRPQHAAAPWAMGAPAPAREKAAPTPAAHPIDQPYLAPGAPPGTRPIVIRGRPCHIARYQSLLAAVAATDVGRETLLAIHRTGRPLVLRHGTEALLSSGLQGCAGTGSNSRIALDLRVPDDGSHLVEGRGGLIPFPLDVVLAHELSHARRCLQGGAPLHVFDWEEDAWVDENRYRRERAAQLGVPFQERTGNEEDRQVWFPDARTDECGASSGGG